MLRKVKRSNLCYNNVKYLLIILSLLQIFHICTIYALIYNFYYWCKIFTIDAEFEHWCIILPLMQNLDHWRRIFSIKADYWCRIFNIDAESRPLMQNLDHLKQNLYNWFKMFNTDAVSYTLMQNLRWVRIFATEAELMYTIDAESRQLIHLLNAICSVAVCSLPWVCLSVSLIQNICIICRIISMVTLSPLPTNVYILHTLLQWI